jgi:predicted O-methyltransferase YrrM
MPAPVLAAMLDALRGTRTVVELGTGTAWGTLALAVADSDRRVLTYDPTVRPNRDNYLALVGDQVRDRIEFREEQASAGPPRGLSVDGLVIDSSHTYDDTVSEFRAWEPAVREGGVVVFDDYLGEVANAVSALGLTGKHVRRLFVWVKNQSSSQ